MPTVAIIILNWNKHQLTIDTVNSIRKIVHNGFKYHLIIVDNGSTDGSMDHFDKELGHDNITYLQTGSNLGYVGGNNFGLQHAFDQKYDYYLIANNDIEVKQDFLEVLITQAAQHPKSGILGPKIYFAPGHEYHLDRYTHQQRGKVIWSAGGAIDWDNIDGTNIGVDEVDTGQFDKLLEPDFISGCCMLIRHDVVKSIGFFDEKYYLYLEDTDYNIRAKQAGFDLLYIPQSVIWHINAGTSSPGSQLHNYFLTRNRLVFAFKFAKPRTKLAIFRESMRVLYTDPSRWRKLAVRDFYLNRLGKGSWQ